VEGSTTPWWKLISSSRAHRNCLPARRTPRLERASQRRADPRRSGGRPGRRIVWVGPEAALMEEVRLMRGGEMLDADGRVVMPGLVDCHTHLAWAGDRADEFQLRVTGPPIRKCRGRGRHSQHCGGDPQCTDEVLRALTRKRLDRFLRYGVTTVEAKSGYGLSLDQELRHLEVYREVSFAHAVDVVPTLLAAHVVPVDYADRPDEYVKLIVKKVIPTRPRGSWPDSVTLSASGGLTVDQCRSVLEPAWRAACCPSCTPISSATWAAPRWPRNSARCRWTTSTT